MNLRFWNRWKRESKKEEELLDLKFDKNVRENTFKKFEPIDLASVTDLGDLSTADDVFIQPKITKGQCMGFLKSGKQCSRNVDTVYCYQHDKNRR